MYTGEMINSLSRLDVDFWKKNSKLLKEMIELIRKIESGDLIKEDYDWSYEEEQSEFLTKIKIFKEKLERIDSDS